MKNIEFKIFDKINKSWSNEDIRIDQNGSMFLNEEKVENDRYDIVWYIGKKDINGNKIYENSIIEGKSKTGFTAEYEVKQLDEYIAIESTSGGSQVYIIQTENEDEEFYDESFKKMNIVSHIYD
jgi:hypothetical protein